MMTPAVFLIAAAFFFFAAAGAILRFCRNEAYLDILEKYPRAKKTGILFFAVAVFWCIPSLRNILEPGSFLQNLLIPLAVLAVILCGIYLDYLCARATAALMILSAHALLRISFGMNCYPYSAFFAAGLFLFGTGGILVSAKPWWLRDYFRLLCRNKKIRLFSAGFLIYLALTALLAFVTA